MNGSRQRDVFLSGEGDAWFQRNSSVENMTSTSDDILLQALLELPLLKGAGTVVAEVGCGSGLRLKALETRNGWQVYGLDPSRHAVAALSEIGVEAHVGTAEKLPWQDNSIDLLIFGFCLYLCDRDDLFQICAEAHRVLKSESWLAILDFWSPHHRSNPYHHKQGVRSFKSNVPAMFCWHPSYILTDHKVRHHVTHALTDDPDSWVAATVIRKSINFAS